jgi:hypothetical protein
VPAITETQDFNGFAKKVERLGLIEIVDEALATLSGFTLTVKEEKHANGTKWLREAIDERFKLAGGWSKITSGGTDWKKANPVGAGVGVEVQVSGRSDMVAMDIMHLSDDITSGLIDVGVIIVPDDTISRFLTDRTPNFATAIKHAEHRAKDLPIRVVGFRHDSVGEALAKMRTNLGREITRRDE